MIPQVSSTMSLQLAIPQAPRNDPDSPTLPVRVRKSIEPASPNRQSPSPKKSVSFNHRVRVKPIRSCKNFSQDEIEATWYTEEDQYHMKQDLKRVVKLLARRVEVDVDGHELCERGLEYRTPAGAQRRIQSKQSGWFAVFDEQEQQINDKIKDPEAIAEQYMEITWKSRTDAHRRALADQLVVHNELKSAINV